MNLKKPLLQDIASDWSLFPDPLDIQMATADGEDRPSEEAATRFRAVIIFGPSFRHSDSGQRVLTEN